MKYFLLKTYEHPTNITSASASASASPPSSSSSGGAGAGAGAPSGDKDEGALLAGFSSFMPTHEDGHEVLYIYELHLQPRLRGYGIGKLLMGVMENIGRKIGVEKVMLTCLVVESAGAGARGFYERLGYGVDEYSPVPKKLRGGVVKKPTYVILSKNLRVPSGEEKEGG